MSFRDLQKEIRRRHRTVGTLQGRRDRLAQRVANLDNQIQEMGGSVNGSLGGGARGGRRARNAKALPQALLAVLKGKTMRVTDAADAVLKAGYKTASKTFRVQVNIALAKNRKLFRRVGRGQYTAR